MGVIKDRPRSAIDASAHEPESVNANDGLTFVSSSDDEAEAVVIQARIEPLLEQPLASLLAMGQRRRSPRIRVAAVPVDTTPPPKGTQKRGSKKSRRYENQLVLMKSAELEVQDLSEVTMEDLSPLSSARTFARLLEDSELMSVWNHFIDAKDDFGTIVIKSEKKSGRNDRALQNEVDAFNGICRKLRCMLRQRHLPLGMMDNLEEDLLQYFFDHPLGTFESTPMDAFRRGLLHALSQYNNLCSYSIAHDKNNKNKIVRIKNKFSEFSPPPIRLVQFIENKMQGRSGHVDGLKPSGT